MFNGKENEAIQAIRKVLNGQAHVECRFDDDDIRDHIVVISRATFRSKAIKEESILISTDPKNKTIMFSDRNNAAAAAIAAAKTPDPAKSVSAPTESEEEKEAAKPVKKKRSLKKSQHSYVPPSFTPLIKSLMMDETSKNIWLVGSTGCGKTHFVEFLAKDLGRKLYKIDGNKDLSRHDFLGEKDISIDEKSGNNFIEYIDGILVQAMQEGLDEDGNEVGEPGILFIDEMGAISTDTAIALNGVLESRVSRRSIALTRDKGRKVVSHSGFMIIAAANVIGRGISSMNEIEYTAQGDALDISTLRRFAAVFRFGYDRNAEQNIMEEKVGDDRFIEQLCKFRDATRDGIRQGSLRTPFSTALIVDICDLYRVWGDIAATLYYGVFEKLNEEEQKIYEQNAYTCFGINVMAEAQKNTHMDYV